MAANDIGFEEEYENSDETNDLTDEEEIIRFYFHRGFHYEEILNFLQKFHDKEMSLSTLKRRIKKYGLQRKNSDYDLDVVRDAVRSLLDGPGCCRGYRAIWHTLQMNGITVPRVVVAELLRELDPEGVQERSRHRLKRRVYRNPGPNYSWHCDGYDKLKPYGFPIHGCIDGWSRKILWLYVTQSNNQPNNIAMYYLEAVQQYNGCPIDFITDLGTENGLAVAIHIFFRNDPNSHRYVSSPCNQRIEGWWSFLRKDQTSWWMNFFKDLVDAGTLDLTLSLHTECLWFCFAALLQENLNEVKENWNSHYIRKSRYDTLQGRPDSLYYLPELHNGRSNLHLPVPEEEKLYAREHIISDYTGQNDFQRYFTYIVESNSLEKPSHWRDALELYHVLINCANNGEIVV
jgi:hypothetical protein